MDAEPPGQCSSELGGQYAGQRPPGEDAPGKVSTRRPVASGAAGLQGLKPQNPIVSAVLVEGVLEGPRDLLRGPAFDLVALHHVDQLASLEEGDGG